MARAFILPKFQGRGFGIKMVCLIENEGIEIWRDKYNDDVIGIDCLDIAPPQKAKIFLNNNSFFPYHHSKSQENEF